MASIVNKISFSGLATGGTTTTVTFADTTYGADAFKRANVTFAGGALDGLTVPVTASTKNTLTFATQAGAPAAGDTFTVAFDDTMFMLGFTTSARRA